MVGWENRSENAPSAGAAENQILIILYMKQRFLSFLLCPAA